MGSWKALLAALTIVIAGFLIGLAVKAPKIDAIITYNPPKLYVPLLALFLLLWVVRIWRDLRKP